MEIEVIHSNNPYCEKGHKKTGNLGGGRVRPSPKRGGIGTPESPPYLRKDNKMKSRAGK